MMLGNIWGDCGMVKGNAQPHLAPPPAPDKTDKAPAAQTNPAAPQTPAEEPKPKENSNVEEAAN